MEAQSTSAKITTRREAWEEFLDEGVVPLVDQMK